VEFVRIAAAQLTLSTDDLAALSALSPKRQSHSTDPLGLPGPVHCRIPNFVASSEPPVASPAWGPCSTSPLAWRRDPRNQSLQTARQALEYLVNIVPTRLPAP